MRRASEEMWCSTAMESAASSLGDYISAEESLGEQSEMGAPVGLTSPERI